MEENTNLTEQTTDQSDAFLDGWNDTAESEQTADQPEKPTEEAPKEADEKNPEADKETNADGEKKDEAADKPAEAKQDETADGEKDKAPEESSWNIKHMGEEKTLKASDVTPELLQKGLDYDRVREKYDEAKPIVEMFTEFAKKAGMSVTDYIKYVRAEAKKASGMSEDEAKRAIELEDREAVISAKEEEQKQKESEENSVKEKVKADLDEFKNAFPEIFEQARTNPDAIPKSVWDEVKSGKLSLTAAYSRYAVAKAQESVKAANDKAEAASQNQKNAERSSGSMKSAGSDTRAKDAFLDGFGI